MVQTAEAAANLRPKREITNEEYSIKNHLDNFLVNNFDVSPALINPSTTVKHRADVNAKVMGKDALSNFKNSANKFMEMLKPKLKSAKTKIEDFFLRTSNMIPSSALDMNESRHKRHSLEPQCGCSSPCQCQRMGASHPPPPPPPPQYIEYVNGQREAYIPRYAPSVMQQQPQKSRYVFDRLGHRYLEHGGSLQLVKESSQPNPIVGGAAPYAYQRLEHILHHNREFIDATNKAGPNYLVQPPIELALETLKFMDDITNVDDVQDYRSAATMPQKRNIIMEKMHYAEEGCRRQVVNDRTEASSAQNEVSLMLTELSRANDELTKSRDKLTN